jgi:hypothetical protein
MSTSTWPGYLHTPLVLPGFTQSLRKKIAIALGEMAFFKKLIDANCPLRTVPLPRGYCGRRCPECGSDKLTGVLLSKHATEADPDILCRNCFWQN